MNRFYFLTWKNWLFLGIRIWYGIAYRFSAKTLEYIGLLCVPRRKGYARNILDTWRIYNPKGSWKNSIEFWSWIRKNICFPIGLENMKKTKAFMEAGAPKTSQVTLPGHVLISRYVPSESENIYRLTWKSTNVAQNHLLKRILIFIHLHFYETFFLNFHLWPSVSLRSSS